MEVPAAQEGRPVGRPAAIRDSPAPVPDYIVQHPADAGGPPPQPSYPMRFAPRRTPPARSALTLVAILAFTLSCGDDSGGPGDVGAVAVRSATTLQVGDTTTATATVTDTRGRPMSGIGVRWQVAPDSVLRIATDGKLTALKEGMARITASAGGRSGTLDVEVRFRQGVPE